MDKVVQCVVEIIKKQLFQARVNDTRTGRASVGTHRSDLSVIYIDKNIRVKNNKKENNTLIKFNYFKNEQEYINSNNLCSFCYINNENLNKYEDDNKLIFCYCNSCKNKIKKEVKYNDNLYVKYIRDKTINKLFFEI